MAIRRSIYFVQHAEGLRSDILELNGGLLFATPGNEKNDLPSFEFSACSLGLLRSRKLGAVHLGIIERALEHMSSGRHCCMLIHEGQTDMAALHTQKS